MTSLPTRILKLKVPHEISFESTEAEKRLVSFLMYFSCLKPRDSVIAIFEINDEENLRKSPKILNSIYFIYTNDQLDEP